MLCQVLQAFTPAVSLSFSYHAAHNLWRSIMWHHVTRPSGVLIVSGHTMPFYTPSGIRRLWPLHNAAHENQCNTTCSCRKMVGRCHTTSELGI